MKVLLWFALLLPPQLNAESVAPFVMGALGDSITTGFNSTGYGDRKADSWSSGGSVRFVQSHKTRLEKVLGRPVEAYNAAVMGSQGRDLSYQLENLMPHEPSYVTLLIGGNDLCHLVGTKPADEFLATFTDQVTDTVKALVQANAQMRINMLPVPDLYQLWEQGRRHSQCQGIWDLFSVCSPLLGSDRTDAQRKQFREIWRELNGRLEGIANDHKQNIVFDRTIADVKFEWQHMSPRDCFHPSGEGQAYLAERTWRASGLENTLNTAELNTSLNPTGAAPFIALSADTE